MSKEMEDRPSRIEPQAARMFEGEWSAEMKTTGQDKTEKGTMTCKMVYGGAVPDDGL